MVLLVLFGFVCEVWAVSEYQYQGVVPCGDVWDEEVQLLGLDASVYVEFKLELLMGEPLRSAHGIVAIDCGRGSTFSARYKGRTFSVPLNVVEEVLVTSCVVRAGAYSRWFGSDISIDFDLGAMGKIEWGPGRLIENWSQEQKEEAFSFNVSGSPNWGHLFYKSGRGVGLRDYSTKRSYLSETDAREFFSQGMQVVKLGSDAVIDFNLNSVKQWCQKQIRKEKVAKMAAENGSDKQDNPFEITKQAHQNSSVNSKADAVGYNGVTKSDNPFAITGKMNDGRFTSAYDPFAQFDVLNAEESEEQLNAIAKDIQSYIREACGVYYADAVYARHHAGGFHLTLDHIESAEERRFRTQQPAAYAQKKAREKAAAERRERKREQKEEKVRQRRRKEMADIKRRLPSMQQEWRAERDSIKPDCRQFIIQKYALEVPIEKIDMMMEKSFFSTKEFEGIYTVD